MSDKYGLYVHETSEGDKRKILVIGTVNASSTVGDKLIFVKSNWKFWQSEQQYSSYS